MAFAAWSSSVPRTYILSYDRYREFLEDSSQFQRQLEHEPRAKLDPNIAYAVRSSASDEDSLAYSFAGQLVSVLSVSGLNSFFQAVLEVYQSVQTPQVAPYLKKMGLSAAAI